ncbi:MAG: tetratricopeptide repeat protein, partial [Trueperaceae bacterium]|nr:tetratricopeptide repeat protein [Trueperaceae bacterium]
MDRPRLLSTALLNRAAFLKQLSRFQEMNASLEECLRLRSETLDGRSYAFAQAALAELRIDQARFAEAEDLLEEALETQELYGPSRFLVNTLSMTSMLHLARGEPLLAWHYAERSLQFARETSGPRVVREILFDAAAASARMGDGAKALALAEEMTALGPETGASPVDECRARWARGLALVAGGDAGAATAELRAALAVARGGGLALEANKVAVDLAAAEGDEAAAAEALAWFDDHGLGVGRALVGRTFPGLLASGPVADEQAPTAAGGAELLLEVLGDMRLGPIGGGEAVKGEQRRLLLACLLQARMDERSEVTDLDLVEALYPSIPEPDAVRALKQLVHQVRRRYGTLVVTRTPGGYAIGAAVGSDAERFLAAAGSGGRRGADGGVTAEHAAELAGGATEALVAWRGPFLKDVPEAREDGVAARLIEVAARVAGHAIGTRPADAARVAQYLQDVAPFEPRLAALEVEARERAGDPAGAAAALARARRRLAEVGELLDAHELERLRAGLGARS